MVSLFFLTVSTNVPATPTWTPTTAIIISACCFLSLLISFRISNPKVGLKMPLLPISIPAFIAAMSFGHIIGTGILLGLTNIGSL
ncbi:photosystem I reaction center subunit PsaK [Calothrix sp. PCC 6303]|uniref:photosystem I reaction center subunit PsaK n=1 Tax=Calothrix sp. PCC 6303 TaxID=1170562 RepID=UPI0005A145CF|nr:photosystem I reaction center subunit PsaK [Calothrix sp. PCC 6303]